MIGTVSLCEQPWTSTVWRGEFGKDSYQNASFIPCVSFCPSVCICKRQKCGMNFYNNWWYAFFLFLDSIQLWSKSSDGSRHFPQTPTCILLPRKHNVQNVQRNKPFKFEWKSAKHMLFKVFILVKDYSHVLCAHPILHLQYNPKNFVSFLYLMSISWNAISGFNLL